MARMTAVQKLDAARRLADTLDDTRGLSWDKDSGLCGRVFRALPASTGHSERGAATRLFSALVATWPDRHTGHYASRMFPVGGELGYYREPQRMDDPRRQALLQWAKGRVAELIAQYEWEVQRGR